MLENLNIITNEKVSVRNDQFYCDNIDLKSIPEELNKYFNLILVARLASGAKPHHIKINKFSLGKSIFSFLFNIFKIKKNNKFLIISITPYTFSAYCLLALFGKKPFVYLRSSGHEEYKYILGFFGKFIYQLMFYLVSLRCHFISCNLRILMGKKGFLVSPSQLNSNWLKPQQKMKEGEIKLLYVGRLKVEKGIFSLIKIIENSDLEFKLTLVSAGKIPSKFNHLKKIKVLDFQNKNDSIIEVYDSHNIFILPSYTEGHPQVLDEALARGKPVIIFQDIQHVIGNRKGVIVSKRDLKSLTFSINYIIKNYDSIQKEMSKNKLPTKETFLNELKKIIKEN